MKRSIIVLSCLLTIVYSCENSNDRPSNNTLPEPARNVDPTGLAALDKSPLDIIYLPPDYPVLKMMGRVTTLYCRIIYSRPFKQKRKIFGEVTKYNEYWRMGANEATEFEVYQSITFQGKRLEPGRYVLYCIPGPDKWIIGINKDIFSWGLKIDLSKDLFRVDAPISRLDLPVEVLTMEFVEHEKNAELLIAWDDIKATVQIGY